MRSSPKFTAPKSNLVEITKSISSWDLSVVTFFKGSSSEALPLSAFLFDVGGLASIVEVDGASPWAWGHIEDLDAEVFEAEALIATGLSIEY